MERRGSSISIEPLEEIVTCPIHLDLLEDPRLLPCSHAFCHNCLMSCLKSLKPQKDSSEPIIFSCPVCRADCPVPESGIGFWPSAITQKSIVQFVKDHHIKTYAKTININSSAASSSHDPKRHLSNLHESSPIHHHRSSRKGSILAKAELLKNLANEMVSRHDQDVHANKTIVIEELNALVKRLQMEESSDTVSPSTSHVAHMQNEVAMDVSNDLTISAISSKRSSYDVQCEVESARDWMRRLCNYSVKSLKPSLSAMSNYSDNTQIPTSEISPLAMRCGRHGDIQSICIDLKLESNGHRRVYVDATGMIISLQLPSREVKRFRPCLGEGIFHVIHLRVLNNTIYVSGILNKNEHNSVGLLFCCDMEGTVIAKSQEYEMDSNSEYLPVQGFDIDSESGEVILAKPSCQEICILNTALAETNQYWVLHDPHLSPCYLCRFKTEREIWATCPRQGTIVILNELNGRYSHFGTTKIFDSLPSHIICTTDKRICFLDDKLARVFWIQKRFDYLCIQRLKFSSVLNRTTGRLLLPLSDNKILVVSDRHIFCAKPSRAITKCSIL